MWCVSEIAMELKLLEYKIYFWKYQDAWQELQNPENGFMQPIKNGNWLQNFNPYEVNNNYTEANAWQYSFYHPHQNYTNTKMLDSLFKASNKTEGRTQADITGLIGQYAQGNEPSHNYIYLLNSENRIKYLKYVYDNFYTNKPDGLIGNEDCGQMSAWYVFSSMGLYPVCPGTKEYDLGTSLFEKVAVYLENGDTLSILSQPKTGQVFSGVTINKRKVLSAGITHNQLMSGCNIEFMFSAPNDSISQYGKRGRTGMLFKTSLSRNVPAVIINSDARVFKTSANVKIDAINTRSATIYYTTDGTEPSKLSKVFNQPFTVNANCVIKAKAYTQRDSSVTTESRLYKLKYDYSIAVTSTVDPQYASDGTQSLMDGIYGSTNWHKGEWLGYSAQNFECLVDMREKKEISFLSLNCLQDTRSWIVFPKQVSFYGSDDGKNFTLLGQVNTMIKAEDYKSQTFNYKKELDKKVKTRYLKIVAENFGKLPEWHTGKGDEAYIFVDELEIR
jgi:hypothetical protein